MKRPQSVMPAVTASLLLAGLLAPGPAPGQAPASRPAEEAREAKGDPAVLTAADAIHAWLEGTPAKQAKTRDDVVKQFPAMTPPLMEQALARLLYDGRLKRSGDGSAADPYRYYDRTVANG